MAASGFFPKINGDIFYGPDANASYYQGALSSTLNYSNINVATSATLIKAANSGRKSMLIFNNSDTVIYVGAAGVTITDGFEIGLNESFYYEDPEAIYGVHGDAGTKDIRYWEVE